jgi:hypothetical protein
MLVKDGLLDGRKRQVIGKGGIKMLSRHGVIRELSSAGVLGQHGFIVAESGRLDRCVSSFLTFRYIVHG